MRRGPQGMRRGSGSAPGRALASAHMNVGWQWRRRPARRLAAGRARARHPTAPFFRRLAARAGRRQPAGKGRPRSRLERAKVT